jgi:hypothetical protein
LRRAGLIIPDGRIIAARPAARIARGERAIPQGIGAMRFAYCALVIAESIIVRVFRRGMACRGLQSAAGRWRSDRMRPEPLLAAS